MRQFCTTAARRPAFFASRKTARPAIDVFPQGEEQWVFLTGKKLLITGVLSNRSIAYGIAKACHAQGAELAFSYVGERFKDRITEFAAEFDSKLVFDCDVADDAQIEDMFTDLGAAWASLMALYTALALPRARRLPATSSMA